MYAGTDFVAIDLALHTAKGEVLFGNLSCMLLQLSKYETE
jgi:hypothetical protein